MVKSLQAGGIRRASVAGAAALGLGAAILLPAAGVSAAPVPTADQPSVYVATSGISPDVDVLAHTPPTAVSRIATEQSTDVALSADGTTAYVAERRGTENEGLPGEVAFVHTATGEIFKRVPIGIQPLAVAVNPVKHEIYVDTTTPNSNAISLWTIDADTFDSSSLELGCTAQCYGTGLAVSADGTRVYVVDGYGTVQTVNVNTAGNTIGKSVVIIAPASRVGIQMFSIVLAPDGKRAYVADSGQLPKPAKEPDPGTPGTPGGIYSIHTDTLTVDPTPIAVTHPLGLAISPDGTRLYATDVPIDKGQAVGTIRVVDLSGGAAVVQASIASVKGQGLLTISPDGKTLYRTRQAFQSADHEPFGAETEALTTSGQPVGTVPIASKAPLSLSVAPDQAPVAKVHAVAGKAGKATTFDASASTVQYGSIVSYRWDFGDASAAVTTQKPTVSHVYSKAGTFTAKVTETDSAGTSTVRVFTGKQVVRNGGPSAVAGARVTISAGVSTGSGHNAAGGGSSSGSSGHLASTGISDLNRNLGVAGVCLLIGGGLLFLGRRRHLARHRPVA